MELNGLAVRLQEECNPETCTQMTATEQWIFLCAAHKTPKEVSKCYNEYAFMETSKNKVQWFSHVDQYHKPSYAISAE